MVSGKSDEEKKWNNSVDKEKRSQTTNLGEEEAIQKSDPNGGDVGSYAQTHERSPDSVQ